MNHRKYALITGSSRGIGKGIALKLAEQGVHVAIHYYQNRSAADNTLAEVRKLGGDGFIVQADVTNPEEIAGIFKQIRNNFGKLDIFVANARPEAPAFFYPPFEITLEQWDAAFDSQAKAFLISVREAVPLMREHGRIIAMTHSPGGRTGSLQPWVAMGSAKAALESLVRYFAVALAKSGITVNAVSPGWIEDSVLNSLPEPAQEAIRNWHTRGWTPMGRLGTPADIGKTVALLCSDNADWITGQVIFADGGASLMDPGHPPELQLGWTSEIKQSMPRSVRL